MIIVFQNYRITAFASFWLSPLKHQKVENQQQKHQQKKKQQKKEINKSLKTIIDKLCVSRFEPQGLRSAKIPAVLKFYLEKYLFLDKKQIKYSQLLQEKSNQRAAAMNFDTPICWYIQIN